MTEPKGIKDIAARCGVSAMTVSRALRGVNGVSAETRKRILLVAEEMHYSPNFNARSLVKSSANFVGISFPNLFNDVFADIFEGMRRTLEKTGYPSVVNTTDYDPARESAWVAQLLSWRPAGIVLTGTDHDPKLRATLRSVDIPTVEIWDIIDDPIDVCVGIDHFQAGVELGELLVRQGYQRPAFVGFPPSRDLRSDRRLQGVRSAFAEANPPVKVRHCIREFSNQFMVGFDGTNALLKADDRPDVILYVNDHMAFGGLSASEMLGFDVPGDVGIVGFNALPLTEVLPRPITTARTPRRQIGEIAARQLIARINGVQPEKVTILPIKIEEGTTTRVQK